MLFQSRSFCFALSALLLTLSLGVARAGEGKAQCIVPAKPGGGMDQTCKLVQHALPANEMEISYLPGGVGAVAWSSIIFDPRTQQSASISHSTRFASSTQAPSHGVRKASEAATTRSCRPC